MNLSEVFTLISTFFLPCLGITILIAYFKHIKFNLDYLKRNPRVIPAWILTTIFAIMLIFVGYILYTFSFKFPVIYWFAGMVVLSLPLFYFFRKRATIEIMKKPYSVDGAKYSFKAEFSNEEVFLLALKRISMWQPLFVTVALLVAAVAYNFANETNDWTLVLIICIIGTLLQVVWFFIVGFSSDKFEYYFFDSHLIIAKVNAMPFGTRYSMRLNITRSMAMIPYAKIKSFELRNNKLVLHINDVISENISSSIVGSQTYTQSSNVKKIILYGQPTQLAKGSSFIKE